jgi:hypothetical protein
MYDFLLNGLISAKVVKLVRYLSGMWFSVALRMDTGKTYLKKNLHCVGNNMVPVRVGLVANVIGGGH